MSNKLTNNQKNHLFLEHPKNTKPAYHEDVLNAIEKHLGTSDWS